MSRSTLSSLLLALPLALFAGACGHHDEHADHEHGAGEPPEAAATNTCPPCGMDVPADLELVELGGLKFAFCNDACRDKVAADPQKYAEFAVP